MSVSAPYAIEWCNGTGTNSCTISNRNTAWCSTSYTTYNPKGIGLCQEWSLPWRTCTDRGTAGTVFIPFCSAVTAGYGFQGNLAWSAIKAICFRDQCRISNHNLFYRLLTGCTACRDQGTIKSVCRQCWCHICHTSCTGNVSIGCTAIQRLLPLNAAGVVIGIRVQ
ncbi:hypothetical protein D3C86_1623680 [compost metagenome]